MHYLKQMSCILFGVSIVKYQFIDNVEVTC